MAGERERRLRELEARIRLLAWERVYIVDAAGSVAFSGDGGEDFAYIPDPIARGRLVLHNHPSGESFSRRDVETLLRVQATEFRLVTRRHRFRLALPSGPPWPAIAGQVNQLYFEELEAASERHRVGLVSAEEGSREVFHRVWVRVAGMYEWDYQREEISDEHADEYA